MAAINITIRLEIDAVCDAVEQLIVVHEGLESRHGDRFRALERRIETALGGVSQHPPVMETVGDTVIMVAPADLTALLVEARGLGLLR